MTTENPPAKTVSAGRITELASELQQRLTGAIQRIGKLNSETKIISINAKMEAARAGGTAGMAFGVVAQSIQDVSKQTADVAHQLTLQTQETMRELQYVNRELATRVRGERLADIALMNVDVIDRNLYERTCDCRWWATDPAVVDACTEPVPSKLESCSRRLGQILDSYTVYFDIVIADLEGRIICNGRPGEFPSVGTFHGTKEWFRTAMQSRTGAEFGFRTVAASELANQQRVLVYSCAVRTGGDLDGRKIGVLAVVFRWDALGQTIVQRTPVPAEERELTRALVIDSSGRVLADSGEPTLSSFDLPELPTLLSPARNFLLTHIDDVEYCIGHARAPGFETYSTGWHGIVMQRVS
jgi:hypothetical protein